MESYKEFSARINSFEKDELHLGNGYFKVNPSIAQKVGTDNKFKNFYGDTVVFALSEDVKKKLGEYVDFLYSCSPQCFCERLSPSTFHVTLHDLSNSPCLSDIPDNENKIKSVLPKLAGFKKIKLISKCIFNMVNTSLVLGLYPADEDNYRALSRLYSVFDEVKKLNYPFTPHSTLAYYNINGFDAHSAKTLENAVNNLNRNRLEFELKDLYYQKFTSMNDYTDIIKLL